ncbi:MAG: sulfide/dihydroorotate dehydrogenase-like FAD/NAD-binding protein [Anaerolineae bacterium]|nr:sulfide/dihydroorotate dehydrogenase-like FAD/NAD-binding protein [Anaerolineae bacterium]
MFLIHEARMIVPNLHQITVEAPEVARSWRPGQFVVVRAEPEGERIPLSVADLDTKSGTITFVFLNVGYTTNRLASLEAGEFLPTVVGPLGNPLQLEPVKSVLLVGGCYGMGSLYPFAKAYHELGSEVIVVSEARSSFLLYWQERYRKLTSQVFCITRDGSLGLRGHVKQMEKIFEKHGTPELMIANGCNHLLQTACATVQPFGIRSLVSLNTIMIDGTGMCGVCRVTVGGETKFACVDGPYFDGQAVDWEELTLRRKSYLYQETLSTFSSSSCNHHLPARSA